MATFPAFIGEGIIPPYIVHKLAGYLPHMKESIEVPTGILIHSGEGQVSRSQQP